MNPVQPLLLLPNNKKGNDVQKIVDKKQKEKDNPLPIPQPKKDDGGVTPEDLKNEIEDKYQ